MKKHMKFLASKMLLLVAISELHAQGYIVPNGVSLFPGGATGSGSIVTVIQNPTNSDFTGFYLDPQGSSTFLFNPFLDEQVRTFLVSSNDSISLQPILSHSFAELLSPNTYVFLEGVPFYLGFYTGYTPRDAQGNYTGIYSNPVFGWGKFVNSQGVIQMLNSALEIEGGGIYAGTQIIIPSPEPGTLALAALGGLLLGFRRRKK
jgi:PEP-CTERM motif